MVYIVEAKATASDLGLCCLPTVYSVEWWPTSYNTLRKHAYSNILKISPPKTKSFQIKILIFLHISAQNIDYGYSLEPPHRGGSNEYPQSMFLSRNKKNIVYPVNPSFTLWKWGLRGQSYIGMFSLCYSLQLLLTFYGLWQGINSLIKVSAVCLWSKSSDQCLRRLIKV